MIYGLLLVIHVFVSFVLIAVILLQAGKGGGLSEMFGGGAAQSILGTRATSFLTRATSVCAVIFIMTSLLLALLSGKRERSLMDEVRLPASGTPSAVQEMPKEAAPAAQ